MRAGIAPALAAGLAALATSAAAQQSPPPAPSFAPANLSPSGVRSLAANCASCHGTNGRGAAGSVLPSLAGRPAAEIALAMTQFRAGDRAATVMQQIAKGFTDAEIEALAAWFATQKP
jgi:cytochrome c553